MNEIPTHTFSGKFRDLLLHWGLDESWSAYVVDFSVLVIILLFSILVYYIIKLIINRILKRLILRSASKWDDYLYEQRVFTRLALLIPALILQISLDPVLSAYPVAIRYIQLGLSLYIAIILILVAISFLNAIARIYGEFRVAESKPIKGYIQIGKIFIWITGGMVIVSLIIGRSPLNVLAGLGALSAVLMLVFKDSLLGFVAGIQLSNNKLLQLGDWITVPKYHADGTVIDISLMTVKVRNFDNSVSMVPSYSLISDSFQNWRSMTEAGGRRLKRSFLIDIHTIRFIDQPFLQRLKEKGFPVEEWTSGKDALTNLGLFRHYIAFYLRSKPVSHKEAMLMVRLLQPAENGQPVEVYAFYQPPDWSAFEYFQSALFEHIYATLPEFGLKAFQREASQ